MSSGEGAPPPKKPGFFGRLMGRGGEAAPVTPEKVSQAPAAAPEPGVREADGETAPMAPAAAEPTRKAGWFQRLKDGLTKTSSRLGQGIVGLFTKRKLDAATLSELEDLLIGADLGVDMAGRITAALAKGRHETDISADEVRQVLAAEVETVLKKVERPLVVDMSHKPHVILVVGVNGGGKTTTIGKLAAKYRQDGKKVVLAAGDTFRAAAVEQLKVWGERTGARVIAKPTGSDASGLAYEALEAAKAEGDDLLIIDSAGRLQNKEGLMQELEKVIRVLKKLDPTAPHDVLLVLDATTGQNALSQVDVFRGRAGVTGLVLTKLDGTARGGVIVPIAERTGMPVHWIGVGESVEDLQSFDAHAFAEAIALG